MIDDWCYDACPHGEVLADNREKEKKEQAKKEPKNG